ncbi:MAG: adenylate/guanylate cyclase domain-containing protein [Chloroflexota bacterium]
MKTKPTSWLSHVFPIPVALVALAAIVLAPFWAYQWYQQPFIGAMFEPNNVVSQIEGNAWPAGQAGVQGYDRLIAVGDQPVDSAAELEKLVSENGDNALALTFIRQDGSQYRVIILPTRIRVGEMVSLFGIPYIVGLAFLLIGLWTYRVRSDQRSSRAFLTFTAAVSIATSTYFDLNTTHHFVLVWALSLLVAAGAAIHLAMVFPQQLPFVKQRPGFRFFSWGLTAILVVPVVREMLWPGTPWAYINTWVWSYLYLGGAILLFLSMLVFRIARSDSPVIRQQSRVIVLGAALAFGPILFTFILPIAFGFLPAFRVSIAFPALIIFPLAVAYAIVRYRMLDIDRLLNNTLTYTLTAFSAVGLFYLLITLISFWIPSGVKPDDPLLVALYLFILVVALNPLRNFMQRAIDRVFYRTRADYRRVLTHLSQELGVSPEMDHTLSMLEQELNAALAPEKVLLYLFDDDDAMYRPHGTEAVSELALPAESRLVEHLNQASGAIWFPPERSLPQEWGIDAAIIEQIACRVFVPLRYEGRMIGFLALGARRSGEPYSGDDLEFLDAVAGQSSLALENVRLFANLQDTLNQTLEMKNLMDDIFASMSSGVITTDIQRQITLFNHAAECILGIPINDVLGKPIQDVLPTLGLQFNLITKSTIEYGMQTLGEELTPTIPSRGPLFLRMSWTPLLDAQLDTKGATIVIDDLTERRQLEAERERIRQTFGRVVAPRVRDRLLADPSNLRLDGISQHLTVLFADIHNFTPFSERTPPEKLFEVLNSYLSLAANVVLEEEGTLDKFMGDAVMAFWNAPDPQPDHILRAARAALAMDKAIRTHRAELSKEHQLYFSIGVSTGEAMVGNVGTTDLFNYTAIGDIVNYASRLESIAEPGQILLSEAAYHDIAGHVIANELPPVKVKGKSEAAVVYELVGLRGIRG